MKKPCRADYFTMEEQTIILQYEEFKHIIQAKSNTAAAKARKECWQKISDIKFDIQHSKYKPSMRFNYLSE